MLSLRKKLTDPDCAWRGLVFLIGRVRNDDLFTQTLLPTMLEVPARDVELEDGAVRAVRLAGVGENLLRLVELGWVKPAVRGALVTFEVVHVGAGKEVQDLVEVLDWVRFARGSARSVEAMLESESAAARVDLKERSRQQVLGLEPQLRGYQAAALSWMLERETAKTVSVEDIGWSLECGVWYNSLLGAVRTSPPTRKEVVVEQPGGLLCDEMGLGKTVCILALVLSRPHDDLAAMMHCKTHYSTPPKRQRGRRGNSGGREMMCLCGKACRDDAHHELRCRGCGRGVHRRCWQAEVDGQFVCPACEIASSNSNKIPGGTLVAAPRAIVSQWLAEAARHAPGLKVFRYEGVRQATKSGDFLALSPRRLASFDLVVASYEALGADLAHATALDDRCAKYPVIGCPAAAVNWTRCVLDEAQRCESGASACAKLCDRLTASARWAVTGTPCGRKGFEDLKGLFAFCRCLPWVDDARSRDTFWKRDKIEPLGALVSRFVWRATKPLVALDLPPLEVRDVDLDFTAVERVFYDNAASRVKAAVASALSRCRDDDALLERVAHQLVALRQACCHPSAGMSSFLKEGGIKKRKRRDAAYGSPAFRTLGEVMANLCLEARLECEESHRAVILARSGLAALACAKAQAIDRGILMGDAVACRLTAQQLYTEALADVDAARRPIDIIGELELTSTVAKKATARCRRGEFCRLDFTSGEWWRLEAEANKRLVAIAIRFCDEAIPPSRLRVQIVTALSGSATETVADLDLERLDRHHIMVAGFRREYSKRARVWRLAADDQVSTSLEVRLFEAEIDTDHLQELHIAHNLASLRPASSEITYDAADLKARAARAEAVELAPWRAGKASAKFALIEAARKVDEFRYERGEGWALLSNRSWCEGVRDGLVKPALAIYQGDVGTWWRSDDFARRVKPRLEAEIDALEGSRRDMLHALLETLSDEPSESELLENAHCSICKADVFATGPRCRHCVLERRLRDYERRLFQFDTEDTRLDRPETSWTTAQPWRVGADPGAFQGERLESFRRDSIAVVVERAISTYMGRRLPRDQLERRRNLIAGREISAMWRLWRFHMEVLSEYDTVRLSKSMIALADSQEHIESIAPYVRNMYVLPNEIEIESRVAEMKLQLEHAFDLRKQSRSKLAHLLKEDAAAASGFKDDDSYIIGAVESAASHSEGPPVLLSLGNTAKRASDEVREDDSWKCAICFATESAERAVMTLCGHTFCADCARAFAATSAGSAKCPKCRTRHSEADILYTLNITSVASKPVRTYGAKIARIAAEVADSHDKCLVFCEWESVLDILSHALNALGVKHDRPHGTTRREWDDKIRAFKVDPTVLALLLNVKTAGNGLTIVEANRVFLVRSPL